MNPLQQPNPYPDYTSLVNGDPLEVLQRQATEFPEFLLSLQEKADFAYAPGKWTIREIAGHLIDTERILTYRLTAIARGEQQNLPFFDEDSYVSNARFAERSLLSFSEEFELMRKANLYLFRSLNAEELDRRGTASGKSISVGILMLTVAGHLTHHIQIIKERYL